MSGELATVLVADDDEDIREVLAFALTSLGYRVAAASDGLEVLAWIEAHGPPGLLLLDLMMPRLDGEGVMRELVARHHDRPPVVILSGHSSARRVAARLGAQGCLVKPVELSELQAVVSHFVSTGAGEHGLSPPM